MPSKGDMYIYILYICINSRRVQFWNFPNWSWQTCQKQTLWRFWSIEPNGFFVFNRGAETVLQLPHRTYLEQSWHQLFVHFRKWLGWISGKDIGGLELNPKLSFNTLFKSSLRTFKNRAHHTIINEFLILGKSRFKRHHFSVGCSKTHHAV